MTPAALRAFDDDDLATLAARLRRLVASPQFTTTEAGRHARESYQSQLDAVRAEIERRGAV